MNDETKLPVNLLDNVDAMKRAVTDEPEKKVKLQMNDGDPLC